MCRVETEVALYSTVLTTKAVLHSLDKVETVFIEYFFLFFADFFSLIMEYFSVFCDIFVFFSCICSVFCYFVYHGIFFLFY